MRGCTRPGPARYIGGIVALLACTGVPHAGLAQAPPPGVFTEVPTTVAPRISPALEPATMRSRVVQVDTRRITAARRGREVLKLNLFDDAVVEVAIRRVRPTGTGYFISGTPKGMERGEVRLVVNGPVLVGTAVTPEGKFTIRSGRGNRHVIRQIDRAKESFECEVEGAAVPGPTPQPPDLPAVSSNATVPAGAFSPEIQAEDMPTEDGSAVRVLVVYTPAMQAEQGGAAGMRALIDLFIQSANEAFETSGINTRLVLAHATMLDYVATGRDLSALSTPDDGHLDEVHALRNEHAADLVHLLTNVVTTASGSATRPARESLSLERTHGFAVTANGSEETFTHEIGHNFGLKHDRYSAPNFRNAIYPYAYGYLNNRAFEPAASNEAQWRTIMAYFDRCGFADFSCRRLFRFSNPDQTYSGDPLGVPADDPSTGADGPADARLAVNKTARWVASYRSEACTDFTITPQPAIATVDGGEITFKVDTAPGCLWNASSNADFLRVTSDARTAGSGFVQVTVEANNTDAERNGTVTVAGQSITVRQLVTSEGICNRTPAVAHAIAKAAGLSGARQCDEVNDEDLAGITELEMNRRGISSLRAGDFAGLTSLRSISLTFNELTVLPAGLFAGLSKLESLQVDFNRLSELPDNIFAGLSNLEHLDLEENELTRLPAGLFAGLSNLEWLDLSDNRLTDLSAGLFSGLHKLQHLNLQANELTQVHGRLFAGLSNLEELILGFNQVRHLPEGVFSGLSMLSRLQLASNQLTQLNEQQFGGLARLKNLSLGVNGLTSVPAGIFRDLTNLQTLDLVHNRLAGLPAQVFANLSNLETLHLDYNQLTEISSGQLAGLSRLRTLHIMGNGLQDLPAQAFSGLSALEELDLFGNDLSQLGQELFSDTPALRTLNLGGNRLRNLPEGLFSDLSSLERLYLTSNRLTSLPDAVFSGLPQLRLLWLAGNRLTDLPDGLFSGLSSLEDLNLRENRVDPLSFSLSLEELEDGKFRVRMPVGAPFEIVLPVSISDSGQLEGGARTVTLSTGAIESDELQVERVSGNEAAVSVEIGPLPVLPPAHLGYVIELMSSGPVWVLPSLLSTDATLNAFSVADALLEPRFSPEGTEYKAYVPHEATSATVTPTASNSSATVVLLDASDMELPDADLSRDGHQAAISVGENTFRVRITSEDETVTNDYTVRVIRDEATNVCVRTPEVRNVIMESAEVDACSEVTAAHLSGVQFLDLERHAISSLKAGDFAGLSSVTSINLRNNQLSKLPGDVFLGLDQLLSLDLSINELASLPVGVFSGLAGLEELYLHENALSVLPAGIFSGPSELKTLFLSDNRLTSLPAGIFSALDSLEQLTLYRNALRRLPADAFSSLHALEELYLGENALTDLPAGIFSALANLEQLSLSANPLGGVATDQLTGLTALRGLNLGETELKQLPSDFLSGFPNLEFIGLLDNEIESLPPDIFSGLGGLRDINLSGNRLNELPPRIFSGLSGLIALDLDENRLSNLPDGLFSGLSGLEYLYLGNNRINPLPLALSLEKAGESGFKAVVPTGAPFDMRLAVSISSAGRIDAPGSTLSISAGALESAAVGVKRVAGTTEAVTVDFAELPVLPRFHRGYTLDQDATLPRTILPGPKGPPPAQVTGVSITPGSEQLEVSWDAVSGVTGYKVQWKSGEGGYDESRQAVIAEGATTEHTITGLTAGTEYTIRVIATQEGVDDGAPSSEVTGTPKASAPGQVTGVSVLAGEDELEVSWTAVSDADGYRVQWRSGEEDYDDARQAVIDDGETTSHTITDLTAGTEYTVRVLATRDNADDGVPSGEVTATLVSVDPDVNGDGTLDGNDALIMYYSYASADQVGDGETGGSAASRQSLLAGYSGKANPTDDELRDMIRKSLAWQEAGVDAGGDINEDGEIDEDDAYVMYHAYANANLVGDGTTGGTARFRQLLLSAFADKANPTDEDLKAMLRRANELKEDFG